MPAPLHVFSALKLTKHQYKQTSAFSHSANYNYNHLKNTIMAPSTESTSQAKVCIFDVDGTLLDTEILYSNAINHVLKDFDKSLSRKTKLSMIGRDTQTATQILIDDTQIPLSPEEFVERVDTVKHQIFKEARLFEGAEKLVRHLHKNNIPISIATCSPRKFFEIKTSNHKDFFALFGDNITCGDDPTVKQLKPHPDIYLIAKQKLGVHSVCTSQCLVFEDALTGVKSGVNAQMRVVWIPDERFCSTKDIPDHKHGACEIISSIKDFIPEKYGLPPYES